MNIKMITGAVAVAVAAGLATGCSSLTSMMPKSEAIAGLESDTQQVSKDVGAARGYFTSAYAEMAKAYGMHEEAETLQAEAGRMAKGDDISYSDEDKSIKEAVDAKIASAKSNEMTLEQKAHVKAALVELGKGLLAETAQIAVTADLANNAKTIAAEAPAQDKPAALDLAATAAALAVEVPGDVKAATQTLAAWRAQAKNLGIDVAKADAAADAAM